MRNLASRRLSWLAFYFLIFCISAEGIARLLGIPQSYTAIFQYDEILGYRYVTDEYVDFADASDQYQVYFDPDGVLDSAGEKPASLIILGDGVVAGLELPKGKRLAARILNRGTIKGVINLAVPGYGLLQQTLMLERWIKTHQAPENVVIVHNLSNDLIDNMPDWEETQALPGVQFIGSVEAKLESPKLPNKIYLLLAKFAKKSRLYGWYQKTYVQIAEQTLPLQQQWLYMEKPPSQLQQGLDTLKWIGTRLRTLSTEYGFKVLVVNWLDWGYLQNQMSNPIDSQHRAISRSMDAMGFRWIGVPEITLGVQGVENWDEGWLVSGTRHANSNALLVIASAITSNLKMDKEEK